MARNRGWADRANDLVAAVRRIGARVGHHYSLTFGRPRPVGVRDRGVAETFYLVAAGDLSFVNCVASYLLPTLIGNVIGGVALVAVGVHAEFFEAESKLK